MRWIIDERLSTSEDPSGTWWDWLKGLSLRDSVTGLVARSGGVGCGSLFDVAVRYQRLWTNWRAPLFC